MNRLAGALLLLCLAAGALAGNYDTRSWATRIVVNRDHSLAITERIVVHFNRPQHGIIRKIPARTQGSNGAIRDVRYQLGGATANGKPEEARESMEGGDWVVRIGRGDATVEGDVEYMFRYWVSGAITRFPDHTELFWNVIPTRWATPIESASVEVDTPKPTPGDYKARILAGPSGSRWGLELALGKPPKGDASLIRATLEPGALKASITKPLPLGTGSTVVVAMPNGTLDAEPPPEQEPSIQDGGVLESGGPTPLGISFRPDPVKWTVGGALPLLILPFLIWLARATGKGSGPIVVKFEPPEGVGPSSAGLMIDGKVDRRDIVAGILEVARKGGFRLDRSGGELAVEVLPDPPAAKRLNEFESQLYGAFVPFGPEVGADALKGQFAAQYESLGHTLEVEAQHRGWLKPMGNCALGCGLVAATVILGAIGAFLSPCLAPLGFVIAIAIGASQIGKIGRWTELGRSVRQELLGLKEFITRANEKELDYMSRVNPTQALFEELLPYAVAFGAVAQWSKAFAGIELQPPDWYSGYDPSQALWTAFLIDDLGHLDQDWGSAMSYSPPSSYGSGSSFSSGDSGFGGDWGGGGGMDSGGGFSGGGDVGGGGGGGGGDSW